MTFAPPTRYAPTPTAKALLVGVNLLAPYTVHLKGGDIFECWALDDEHATTIGMEFHGDVVRVERGHFPRGAA